MITCLLPVVDKIVEHAKYNIVDVVNPLYYIVVLYEDKQHYIKCTKQEYNSRQVGTSTLCNLYLDMDDNPVIFELA